MTPARDPAGSPGNHSADLNRSPKRPAEHEPATSGWQTSNHNATPRPGSDTAPAARSTLREETQASPGSRRSEAGLTATPGTLRDRAMRRP